MSNEAKPFVAQHSVPSGVTATRWWWVRHAPVRSDGGNIYGQKDMDCDTSDRVVFDAVSKILPRNAAWFASNLKRTHQTADAIWAAGFPKPETMPHEADLAEQHLGDWQGLNRAEFFASRPIAVGSYWFMDLYNRVRRTIERINVTHAGQDVVAVAHGGTIKAAIGLALNGQPERGLAFTIDNCSVTRLDHLASDGHSGWRVPMVNQQPWLAHTAHDAMHQPSGPEVASATKLA
jgi:alpha-ribazole phosphatase